jgi:uncharacterized protein RhaS with RHS repeats
VNPDAVTQIANGLSTTTFAYDNNGNVTQKTVDGTTTTYVYDYANRLTALGVGAATTTYTYDWAGNRVSQTGTTTTYFYPFKWYSVASSTGSGASREIALSPPTIDCLRSRKRDWPCSGSTSFKKIPSDRQRLKKAPPAPRPGGSIAIETATGLQTLVACDSVGTKGIPQ